MTDEILDTGDEKQVKSRKTKFKIARDIEIAEFKDILSTKGGRAWVWRLLTECKINDFGYCGDNNKLNNIEGRRFIGAWVLEEVFTSDPNSYIMMRNETNELKEGKN